MKAFIFLSLLHFALGTGLAANAANRNLQRGASCSAAVDGGVPREGSGGGKRGRLQETQAAYRSGGFEPSSDGSRVFDETGGRVSTWDSVMPSQRDNEGNGSL